MQVARIITFHYFVVFLFSVVAPPTLNKDRDQMPAKDEQETQVVCVLNKGNPLPTFEWKFQTIKCPEEQCQPDESKWLDVPANLILTPTKTNRSAVKVEASQSAAFYRCQASNTVGNDSHVIELVRLGKEFSIVLHQSNFIRLPAVCFSLNDVGRERRELRLRRDWDDA